MNYVFSYGTLIDKFPQKRVEATLIDCFRESSYGQYPALVKDTVEHTIKGCLISLTNREFRHADYYEGYPTLYNRVERNIIVGDEKIKAWVYILDEKDETKIKNIEKSISSLYS